LIELIAAVGHQESNSQFYFVKNYTGLKGVDVSEKLQGFDAMLMCLKNYRVLMQVAFTFGPQEGYALFAGTF